MAAPNTWMNATKNATKTTIILGLLLLTGVLLRIYQLGVDSFWVDEIGVAYAARQATLQEMFQAMDNHIMAVPLDYIVAWLFARVDASEAFLRLPAVMWGIAALPVGYALFSRLSGRSVALLSTGLLAVSPLHVQYSQELRFYAALVFFYLLSSLLLLRAIQTPASGIRNWIVYTFIAIIGMYFHIYVLLVLVNGVAWLWLTPDSRQTHSIQKIYFIRSAAVLLVAFLLSVLLFGSVNMSVEIPLFLYGDSFLEVLGVALGWLPFYSIIPVLPWIFGGLCFVFAVIGMAASIAKAPRGPASVLIFSLAAQIAGIILMNYLKNYFLASRQFLFALPFMLYYTAFGVQLVAERLTRSLPSGGRLSSVGIQAILAGVLLIASLPALNNYYAGDKGKVKEVSQQLMQVWQPGDAIVFIPDFEFNGYKYYWDESGCPPDLYRATFPADWDELAGLTQPVQSTYLVTYFLLPPEQSDLVRSLSYESLYLPDVPSRYSFAVWKRSN